MHRALLSWACLVLLVVHFLSALLVGSGGSCILLPAHINMSVSLQGIPPPGQESTSEGLMVNVNNTLVPEDTKLKNGDYIICSRELQKI